VKSIRRGLFAEEGNELNSMPEKDFIPMFNEKYLLFD
jgi:hypothetical protein